MRQIRKLARSMVLRVAFCSQGEHKRETIDARTSKLQLRCIDCGRTIELGWVRRHASNAKASSSGGQR